MRDPRIKAIDRQRGRIGLTHRALCELSGLHPTHWYDLRRGAVRPTRRTLDRLQKAVIRRRRPCPPPVLAHFFWTVAGLFGEAYGLELSAVFDSPRDPRGAAAKCRRLATYVLTVELCVDNVDLAVALGQSRQNIHKGRNIVELRRDDPTVDELIERVSTRVRSSAPTISSSADTPRRIDGR